MRFLLSLRGVLALDIKGVTFNDPAASDASPKVLLDAVRLTPDRELVELDIHTNDSAFAQTAVKQSREICTTEDS